MFSQIGFDAGDGNAYYTVPWSGSDAVLRMTQSSNVGIAGRWVFRVDGTHLLTPNAQPVQGQ